MSKRDEDIRKFKRAAEQRLRAAELLFENEFYLEAIYIAGYAIECTLKHLILKRSPQSKHPLMLEKLTKAGAKGHDFDYLKGILIRAPVNCAIPEEIHEMWRRVSSWSTQLRYEVTNVKFEEARRFLDATERIRAWVERS
jgi:HEPN domain-containing protein